MPSIEGKVPETRPPAGRRDDAHFQEQIAVHIVPNVVLFAFQLDFRGRGARRRGELAYFRLRQAPCPLNGRRQVGKVQRAVVAMDNERAVQRLGDRYLCTLDHAAHHGAEGVGHRSVFRRGQADAQVRGRVGEKNPGRRADRNHRVIHRKTQVEQGPGIEQAAGVVAGLEYQVGQQARQARRLCLVQSPMLVQPRLDQRPADPLADPFEYVAAR